MLQPLADGIGPTWQQRTRRALKALLRTYGLKATAFVRPEDMPTPLVPLPEDLDPRRSEPPF